MRKLYATMIAFAMGVIVNSFEVKTERYVDKIIPKGGMIENTVQNDNGSTGYYPDPIPKDTDC